MIKYYLMKDGSIYSNDEINKWSTLNNILPKIGSYKYPQISKDDIEKELTIHDGLIFVERGCIDEYVILLGEHNYDRIITTKNINTIIFCLGRFLSYMKSNMLIDNIIKCTLLYVINKRYYEIHKHFEDDPPLKCSPSIVIYFDKNEEPDSISIDSNLNERHYDSYIDTHLILNICLEESFKYVSDKAFERKGG